MKYILIYKYLIFFKKISKFKEKCLRILKNLKFNIKPDL